jgi:hypothetical protein
MPLRRLAPALLAFAAILLAAVYVAFHVASTGTNGTAPQPRGEAVRLHRIFGRVVMHKADRTREPFDQGEVDPAGAIEVTEDVALLVTPEGDEIFVRAPSLLRLQRTAGRRELHVDRGEALLCAGDSDWLLRCAAGAVRARESEVGLTAAGRIAVVRGPVTAVAGTLELPVDQGEVAKLHTDRVSGSLLENAAELVTWAGAALADRAVPLAGDTAAVRPASRYLFRGISSGGAVAVRAGDRTLASWADLPSRFSVHVAVPEGVAEVRVSGRVLEASMLRIGGD